MTHQGQCFCGAVRIEVSGNSKVMSYCHCQSCRSWSAAPVNAFTLWPVDAVRVTAGKEALATPAKTAFRERLYCAQCGGPVMTRDPTVELVDVYAATIPSHTFVPGVHVNYAATVLPLKDGLPKFRDFPAELGGSGEMVAE